jgi:hypothetical protein
MGTGAKARKAARHDGPTKANAACRGTFAGGARPLEPAASRLEADILSDVTQLMPAIPRIFLADPQSALHPQSAAQPPLHRSGITACTTG